MNRFKLLALVLRTIDVMALAWQRVFDELDLWYAIVYGVEDDQIHDFMEPQYGDFDVGGGDGGF